ncbi:MAG: YidC/Oxa1 family membrane protein insertase [Candidatus Tokpelaia sp. JSC085]|nr:MAG: YidC/Oxa1 family membrane protein insertase [Candidatus Tokpelaia sp. JSC085]
MEYNRNFLVAIVLSLLVITGWQFFFVSPKKTENHKTTEVTGIVESKEIHQTGVPREKYTTEIGRPIISAQGGTGTPVEMTARKRMAVIRKTDRIAIETPHLKGSISLVGARIDDLLLKNYHMTVKKTSPNIALLNPMVFKQGYFAEFGFSSDTLKTAIPRNETRWKITGKNQCLTPESPVQLVFDNGNGLIFLRKISVDDQYMFTFEDSVKNLTKGDISLASYGRISRVSPPDTASGTYLLHEGLIGIIGNDGLKTKTYDDLSEAKGADRTVSFNQATGGWIGITDKYWAVALIPSQTIPFEAHFSFDDVGGTDYQSSYLGKAFSVASGATKTIVNHVFAGAKQVDVIDNYEKKIGIKQFELLIDWGWLNFITKPMFVLIDWLYQLVGNFGFAILLVTVILKIVLFPLANKSYKSMARMKNVQPAMMEIREKYAEDKIRQQQAIVELYRREKINPLAGCWPLIIQFPIFFALYKVLYITIEMRHAPFFGWIQDLAAPDPTSFFNCFGLLPYNVPHFLMIGFWPIVMGITMFLQMRMNPTPHDPTQAMLFNWMPIIFTWMLAGFPAGLVIYWAWNNTLSIIQQAIIMKRQGSKIELLGKLRRFSSGILKLMRKNNFDKN